MGWGGRCWGRGGDDEDEEEEEVRRRREERRVSIDVCFSSLILFLSFSFTSFPTCVFFHISFLFFPPFLHAPPFSF